MIATSNSSFLHRTSESKTIEWCVFRYHNLTCWNKLDIMLWENYRNYLLTAAFILKYTRTLYMFVVDRYKNEKRDVITFSFISPNTRILLSNVNRLSTCSNISFSICTAREHFLASVNIFFLLVHAILYVRGWWTKHAHNTRHCDIDLTLSCNQY